MIDLLKEIFDNDLKILDKALEQDKKTIDLASKWVIDLYLKLEHLVEVLMKKGIIDIKESNYILKSKGDEK